jgi:hypothetical protein
MRFECSLVPQSSQHQAFAEDSFEGHFPNRDLDADQKWHNKQFNITKLNGQNFFGRWFLHDATFSVSLFE